MVGLSATVFISIHPDWLKDHPHWTWSIYGLTIMACAFAAWQWLGKKSPGMCLACVMVCVITRHFAAFCEAFHRRSLRFHTDVGVPLQHPPTDVSCNRHDG